MEKFLLPGHQIDLWRGFAVGELFDDGAGNEEGWLDVELLAKLSPLGVEFIDHCVELRVWFAFLAFGALGVL